VTNNQEVADTLAFSLCYNESNHQVIGNKKKGYCYAWDTSPTRTTPGALDCQPESERLDF
jgi:hypothetical protein